jgi:hypothetical protein
MKTIFSIKVVMDKLENYKTKEDEKEEGRNGGDGDNADKVLFTYLYFN